MAVTQTEAQEVSPAELQHKQIARYWAADLARRVYLFRRQPKAVLENCRRVAVVGASSDPNSPSYIAIERLLGLGLEIVPIFTDRESFLGVRCFRTLHDVQGNIDIVQVYPSPDTDFVELAHAAVDKGINTFWIEQGVAASREVEEILASGRVQLVEYESLETEYLKHVPFPVSSNSTAQGSKSNKGKGADVQKSCDGETGRWTQRRHLENGAWSFSSSAGGR